MAEAEQMELASLRVSPDPFRVTLLLLLTWLETVTDTFEPSRLVVVLTVAEQWALALLPAVTSELAV